MKFHKIVPALLAATVLTGCFEKSADEHYQQAQTYLSEQNIDTAIIELKNAIAKEPDAAKYRLILGQTYFFVGAFAQAEKELSKAKELGDNSKQLNDLLTQASYYNYNSAGILTEYNLKATPTNIYYAAMVDLQDNRLEEAREKLNQLKAQKGPWATLAQAYLALIDNKPEQTLTILKQVATAESELAALLVKAQALQIQGLHGESASVYQTIVEKYSQHMPFVLQLASVYINAQQFEQAGALTTKLIKRHEKHPYINYLHSQVTIAQKDFIQAKQLAEYAIQNRIDNPTSRLIAGFSNYQLGKYEQAYEHLKVLEGKLPLEHFANKLLVDLQLRLGYQSEALSALNTMTDNNQADPQLLASASHFMIQAGNQQAAESLLASSIELSSENSEDLTRQGILLLQMNRVEQGTAALEQALHLTPEFELAEQSLATAYLSQGQLDKAQEIARRWQAEDEAEEKAKGWLLQSAIEQKRGSQEQAKQSLEKVLQIDAKNISATFQLGLFAHQAQEFDLAYDYYQRTLKHSPQHQQSMQGLIALAANNQQASKITSWFENNYRQQADNLTLAVNYAFLLASTGKPAEGISILEKARRENQQDKTKSVYVDTALANIYQQQNDFDQAAYYLKSALDKGAHKNLEKSLLNVYEKSGDFQQALALINSKLKEMPNDKTLQLLKVYYQSVIKQIPDKSLLASLQQSPEANKHWLLHKTLGNIAMNNSKFDEAITHYNNLELSFPREQHMGLLINAATAAQKPKLIIDNLENSKYLDSSFALNMALANAYLATQNTEKAYSIYQQVNDKFPVNFVALNNLAYLAKQKGDIKTALTMAKKAYELEPENPGVLDTYASVLAENNQHDKALELYDEALYRAPKNFEISLNKIKSLKALGLNSQAQSLAKSLDKLSSTQQQQLNEVLMQ